jgi:hypothetical protein
VQRAFPDAEDKERTAEPDPQGPGSSAEPAERASIPESSRPSR